MTEKQAIETLINLEICKGMKVSVRKHGGEDLGQMTLYNFITNVVEPEYPITFNEWLIDRYGKIPDEYK